MLRPSLASVEYESSPDASRAPGRSARTDRLPPRTRSAGVTATSNEPAAEPRRAPAPIDDPFALHLPGANQALEAALRASTTAASPVGDSASPGATGRPLPSAAREHFEATLGADLSTVRIHEDGLAAALGARAFARGEDLHFAPGQFDPDSVTGRELIGHELTHVLQQRAGVVRGAQGKGAAIETNPELEAEADRVGARAARGEAVSIAGGGGATPAGTAHPGAPIQGVFWSLPLLSQFTQGLAEGALLEGTRQIAIGEMQSAIDQALLRLEPELAAALADPNLMAQLRALNLAGDVSAAAADMARSHAEAAASRMVEALRCACPSFPPVLVPDAVAHLSRRLHERIEGTYVKRAFQVASDVVRETVVATGMHSAVDAVRTAIDRRVLGAVRDTMQVAAEPAIEAARPVLETGAAVIEAAEQLPALPLPWFLDPRRIGRRVGRGALRMGAESLGGQVSAPGMNDLLRSQQAMAVRLEEQAMASAAPWRIAGIDPTMCVRALMTAYRLGGASNPAQAMKLLVEVLVEQGLTVAGAMLIAPLLVPLLPAFAASAAPVAGGAAAVALGRRFVMPLTAELTDAVTARLEAAFGDGPLGQVAHGVHGVTRAVRGCVDASGRLVAAVARSARDRALDVVATVRGAANDGGAHPAEDGTGAASAADGPDGTAAHTPDPNEGAHDAMYDVD